jgi:hypothetical protein
MRQNAENGFLGEWHPSLLATKANAEDNPTWDDAMNGPYSQGFKQACQLEIDTQMKMECWDAADRPRIGLSSQVPGLSRLSVFPMAP